MPTLLGLATGEHDSQDVLPPTMDGTNLARRLLNEHHHEETEEATRDDVPRDVSRSARALEKSTSRSTSASLLIEYTSQGDVVRYQHLMDTYNHSFVALRITPTGGDPGVRFVAEREERRSNERRRATTNQTSRVVRSPRDLPNLKYVEFRNSRADWTNTRTPPLERELYDLDEDPYELNNLLPHDGDSSSSVVVSPTLLKALEEKTKRLIRCAGPSCRREHATGLDYDDDVVAASSSVVDVD